jgi:phenylpyruvate tautomerase PptA (4-oxalocrotonate tautomerase family)
MEEALMPIVRIDIQAGKSTAYKRDILHSVRRALTSIFEAPDDRVMIRLIETPAENIDAPDIRTDRLTIIEVSTLPEHAAAVKQSLYAKIVAELGEKPGIHQHDITLLISVPTAECFAMGGVMQCTVPSSGLEMQDHLAETPATEAEAR